LELLIFSQVQLLSLEPLLSFALSLEHLPSWVLQNLLLLPLETCSCSYLCHLPSYWQSFEELGLAFLLTHQRLGLQFAHSICSFSCCCSWYPQLEFVFLLEVVVGLVKFF
jgi:hypothetical protein